MATIDFDEIQELLSTDSPSPEGIERLQMILGVLNEKASTGSPVVADAVYDRLKYLLQQAAPNSPVLHQLWDEVSPVYPGVESSDSLDSLLAVHPMESIHTVKEYSDPFYTQFCDAASSVIARDGSLRLHISHKIDGWGIRVIYKDGKFVKATSRARSTRGRDLTKQVANFVPQTLPVSGLVEIRGEAALPKFRLEKARSHNPKIVNSFTAVASLIRPSASDEESSLLDFVAYRFLTDDPSYIPTSRSDEYEYLSQLGFYTPGYETSNLIADSDTFDPSEDIKELFESFIEDNESHYQLDGAVIEFDDVSYQNLVQATDIDRPGSLALKTGEYSQGMYTGYVVDVEYKPGRIRWSPVAKVSQTPHGDPGVVTSTGSVVENVPLYHPANLLHLEVSIGAPLNFYADSQAGVMPCFPDGTKLADDAISAAIDL